MRLGENGEVVLQGARDFDYIQLGAKLIEQEHPDFSAHFYDRRSAVFIGIQQEVSGGATIGDINNWSHEQVNQNNKAVWAEYGAAEIVLDADYGYLAIKALSAVTQMPKAQALKQFKNRRVAQGMIEDIVAVLDSEPVEARNSALSA
jgi:hypothetical protein